MWLLRLLIISLWTCSSLTSKSKEDDKSRQKRFLWMTQEKRLVLPPGTQLVLTPTLAMPLLRYPPSGLDANLTISTPFTLGFDAMGLTDNSNPIGLMPFLNPGFGIIGKRKKRHSGKTTDPDLKPHKIAGGERVLLYQAVEDLLFKFGYEGKACLLRAICEMHESPLIGYGFFGEVLELFLTPSFSPYAVTMADYISAEKAGHTEGECWRYYKDCSQSFFYNLQDNKYTKEAQDHHINKKDFDINSIADDDMPM